VKKVLIALMSMLVVVGLVGGGAFAYFSDTETSTANTFTAGTLNLKVDQDPTGGTNYVDNPDFSAALGIAAGNLKPGDSQTFTIGIQNAGTIAGIPTIKLIDIVNDENGLIEPELTLGDNATTGELGANVDVTIAMNGGTTIWTGKLNDFTATKVGPSLAAAGMANWNITMSINTTVGNIIQSDKVTFKVVFGLYQDNAEAVAGTTPY
jgi:spore coat-associated protein N